MDNYFNIYIIAISLSFYINQPLKNNKKRNINGNGIGVFTNNSEGMHDDTSYNMSVIALLTVAHKFVYLKIHL